MARHGFAALCVLASFGIGNMVQTNSVSGALQAAFGIPKPLTGVVIAVIVALAAFGGVRQIAKVCES